MRIYMQTPAHGDQPPRFYHLILEKELLEGWSLIREWGHQGSPGRVRRDHYTDFDSAEQELLKVRDAQIGRGFRVVFVQGSEAPP